MRLRKQVVICLLVAGLSVICGCPWEPLAERAEEEFDLSLASDGITTVEIEWINGGIAVALDDTATEITATGTKFAIAGTTATAEEAVQDITVELTADAEDPTLARLVLDWPTPPTLTRGADVELVLPAGVTLVIDSANGDVEVEDNIGPVTIALANGDVDVINNEGDVTITLGNGDLLINGAAGDTLLEVGNGDLNITDCVGALDVDLGNGDLDITNQQGDVEANLGFGSLTVTSAAGDVKADVAVGEIDIAAAPAENGTVAAEVATGDIRIRVPADFAASLLLETSIVGQVNADLTHFDVDPDSLVEERTEVRATLNGGGGTISADIATGEIDFGASDTGS